jgi:hypothetical protein
MTTWQFTGGRVVRLTGLSLLKTFLIFVPIFYVAFPISYFTSPGRSDDLSILVNAINLADDYIFVAVSDYAPMNVFGKQRKPWLVLDDLLREAVLERGVHVRLMLSERAYTYKHRKEHLESLLELNTQVKGDLVEVKIFHVISKTGFTKERYQLFSETLKKHFRKGNDDLSPVPVYELFKPGFFCHPIANVKIFFSNFLFITVVQKKCTRHCYVNHRQGQVIPFFEKWF